MHKPMDTEAISLMTQYKHHIRHTYASAENQAQNEKRMRDKFTALAAWPITEFSQAVWDELEELQI